MKKIMIFMVTFFVYTSMSAQVTVGMNEMPHEGALLDLKENKEVGLTPNSKRGLLFPRVSLESSKSLKPLIAEAEEHHKESSIGMIVYNVNDDAEGVKIGLSIWNGEQWSNIEGGGAIGSAIFSLNCEGNITIKGTLVKGKSLNLINNTVILPVNVEKTGKYTILATTENGYYFSSTGEFLQKGKYEVILTGMGSPNKAQKDVLNFYINDVPVDTEKCFGKPQTITVEDIAPNYFIIRNIDVSGANLMMNQISNGYLTLRIQANAESAGAHYHVETDTQDGIKFEANGVLVPGIQAVTLICNGGTPSKMGVLNFNITCNSTDPRNDDLTAEIIVKGRTVKVLVMCNTSTGNAWHLITDRGVGMLLKNPALFGPNSKYCPIENVNITTVSNNAYTDFTDVDVVLMSYPTSPSSIMVGALTTFVNNGGALIQCHERGSEHVRLINNILNSHVTNSNTDDRNVKLSGVKGDSIVYNGGYLSDLNGRFIGYDGGGNSVYNNVNDETTDILARTNSGGATILKSKTKTYMVIGDGAPFAGGLSSFCNGSSNYRPLMVTSEAYPTPRITGDYKGVYNAHFFVNAMIWAINRRLAVAP